MMSWLVLIFAIAIAIYIERMLIPLVSTPRLRIVFRWNYVNGVIMAAANLHPWLRWAQIVFTLCFGVWAMYWAREILLVEEQKEKQRQILREREEAERIARYEEFMRKWAEDVRVARLQSLATKGCPLGFDCDVMGSDGQGDCFNYKACGGR